MDILGILDQAPRVAEVIAFYLKKELDPVSDLLTTNTAYKDYGRSWIEGYVKQGLLTVQRHGKKRLYSRAQIELIRAKENEAVRIASRKRKG